MHAMLHQARELKPPLLHLFAACKMPPPAGIVQMLLAKKTTVFRAFANSMDENNTTFCILGPSLLKLSSCLRIIQAIQTEMAPLEELREVTEGLCLF